MKHTTMTMTARGAAAALALLVLAGCGSEDSSEPTTPPAATASDAPSSDATSSEATSSPSDDPTSETAPSSEPTPEPGNDPAPDEPEIIAYAGGEAAGFVVRNPQQARRMTEAPADFRRFIGQEAVEAAADDACPGKARALTVEFVSTSGWATGSSAACGGSRVIWGVVDGEWQEVLGTTDPVYDCQVLQMFEIPSDIAGDTCLDYTNDGPPEEPYSQA